MDNKFDIKAGVNNILKEFKDEAMDALNESIEETSKESVKKLKATSPKNKGKYARGWRADIRWARLGTSATIYNVNYRLPHLLEHGHATRNGNGRVYPDTPAHPHIAKVEEGIGEEILKKLEKKVRG